jgi:hypothetical protein
LVALVLGDVGAKNSFVAEKYPQEKLFFTLNVLETS